MDLHPSREMVASGQKAGRNRKTQAHIRIWSTETLQTLYVFGMGEFEIGVAAVAFSQLVIHTSWCFRASETNVRNTSHFQNGGSYVLAVDGGRESILSVWQWQWGHLLGKVAVNSNLNIICCIFILALNKYFAIFVSLFFFYPGFYHIY